MNHKFQSIDYINLLLCPMWILIGIFDYRQHSKFWFLAILAGISFGLSSYFRFRR